MSQSTRIDRMDLILRFYHKYFTGKNAKKADVRVKRTFTNAFQLFKIL